MGLMLEEKAGAWKDSIMFEFKMWTVYIKTMLK